MMSEKLLQEILKELKSINETLVASYVHTMNMDHKMDLLLENTENLEKANENLDSIRVGISDLENKIVYHMPDFNGLEYVINEQFPKVIKPLEKIEKNTRP